MQSVNLGVRAGVLAAVAGLSVGAAASEGVQSSLNLSTERGADVTLGWIEISGSMSDAPGPFDWLDPESATFSDLLAAFDTAAEDDAIDGVVVRLKDATLGQTQIEELGKAFEVVQEAGKQVHVFSEQYATGELLVAAHADRAMIQSGGGVYLTGLHVEEMYLADTMSWIGVEPQFVQVGDYKGASEAMMRSEPSPEWDRNFNRLLDGLYGNIRSAFKQGRSLSDAQLDEAMSDLWLADADDAIEHGLIDEAVDLPLLTERLAELYGGEVTFETDLVTAESGGLDTSDPFALFRLLSASPDHGPDGDSIAVLHVSGAIVDGDSQPAGLFGGQGTVGSRTIRNAIEDIRDEDEIKGVVVRIDSPGGSATASEVMWLGLRRLAETKPVWVSVGSMAASGGYYTLVGGDRVYVNPSSIVGSIGVVGGKLSMADTYDHLKLRIHTRSRGPKSGMFSSDEPWTESELADIRSKMTETYDLFTSRVTAGREGIDLDKTAEGRLFTGTQAIALNMADAIGGLDDAVSDLATSVGLSGDFGVVHYPAPKSLDELFGEMLPMVSAPISGGGLASGLGITGSFPMLEAARELIGPERWDAVATAMQAAISLRTQPVQLIMPRVLIVR